MKPRTVSAFAFVSFVVAFFATVRAQVRFDRIRNASAEPHNWLTYSGGLMSQRYSPLTEVTPANVKNLELNGSTRCSRWRSSRRPRSSSTA